MLKITKTDSEWCSNDPDRLAYTPFCQYNVPPGLLGPGEHSKREILPSGSGPWSGEESVQYR